MKVGIIGLGWMGGVHLRVYSQMRDVEIVCVVDVDEAKLAEVRKTYGVPVSTSMDDLIAARPDAVSVCVPTVLHHEVGLALIHAGVNLLIEKPLATSAAQAAELVDAASAKGVALMVGHIERFNPAVTRIRELVADDPTDIISIMIERVGPYPPRIQDVGVIRDLASHDIDLVRYITGDEYAAVSAVVSSNLGDHEDTAIITGQMQRGVLAQMNCNWVTPYKSRNIRVATKTRYIEGNLITQQVKEYSHFETYEKSYSVREWPVMYREPIPMELDHFLDCVREGTPPLITGEDGRIVLEVIERLDASSAACGEQVTLGT